MSDAIAKHSAFQMYLREVQRRMPLDDDGKVVSNIPKAEYAQIKQDAYTATAANRKWKRALGERGHRFGIGAKARSVKTRRRP